VRRFAFGGCEVVVVGIWFWSCECDDCEYNGRMYGVVVLVILIEDFSSCGPR
jgi:hypothetical protein